MKKGRGITGTFRRKLKPLPWPFLFIFLFFIFIIAISGYLFYRKQKKEVIREQTTQLQAIADLKAADIGRWLQERTGDAKLIMENPFLITRLLTFLNEHGNSRRQEPIRQWMASLRSNFHYQNVMLLDKSGQVLLFLDGQYPVLGDEGPDMLEAVRRRKNAAISDLYISAAVPFPHLDIFLPLIANSEIAGFVLLRSDPAQFLYPMIQFWPTPSPSAETLLVRRDSDSVLYLNELRHRKNTAMKLRLPISKTNLPAVQAALGKTGAFSGRDYRGVAVWSVIRPVPDSPWFIVAKIDRDEIERPIRRNTQWIFLVALSMVLAAALMILFLWQRQNARFRLNQLEALRESEDKFKYVFDNSLVGKSITLPDGEINVNKAFCDMLGYSAEELKSHKWQELTHADDIESTEKALNMIVSGKKDTVRFEKRYLHKNGTIVWADVSTALRRDAQGQPLYFMTSVLDITERKQAEERLIKSESKLRAVLDATPFPIAIVDLQDDKINFWSRSAFTLFGHTAPTASEWYELAYPDPEYRRNVVERWKPFMEKARSSGKPVNTGEYRVTCRDGSVRICELYATFLEENLIVTFNDISKRTRAEDEIRQRVRELAALNELGQQVSRTISLDEVVAAAVQEMVKTVHPNAAFLFLREGEKLTMAGIGPESAAKKFSEMPEHRIGECMCGLAVAHGKPLFSPDIYRDQRCTWDECKKAGFRSFAALPLYSGTEIIGVLGLACQAERDFELQTEFLETMASQVASGIRNAQLHEQVRHYAAKLEQRVQQRTAQLEAANKELEAFSYSVSHDLRAPLRAIDGFSRIILEEYTPKLDDEGRRLFDVVRDNTHKMGQLIDDLLAFSRLSRQQMAFATVDLAALANSVISELKSLEKERKIEFTVDSPPPATGDRAMLRLVLQNLLANAIKFTRTKTRARIEFSGRESQRENIYQVKDNGVGFDMKYVDKLFGVFQRLHDSKEFEGTGVGLAIVQRIVLRHGGRVWAESGAKGGTTFYFSLPVGLNPRAGTPPAEKTAE